MGKLLVDVSAAFRQWRQPREFRIRATAWPEEALTALAELAQSDLAVSDLAVSDLAESGPVTAAEPAEPEAEPREESAAAPSMAGPSVADVVTSIWRLRNRIEAAPEGAPRAVVRHLEMAWDALSEAGVEIQDHLHQPFDPGQALNVLAYQPTPGLGRDQVIEAIRPSVYLNSHTIQIGEVIVGTRESV